MAKSHKEWDLVTKLYDQAQVPFWPETAIPKSIMCARMLSYWSIKPFFQNSSLFLAFQHTFNASLLIHGLTRWDTLSHNNSFGIKRWWSALPWFWILILLLSLILESMLISKHYHTQTVISNSSAQTGVLSCFFFMFLSNFTATWRPGYSSSTSSLPSKNCLGHLKTCALNKLSPPYTSRKSWYVLVVVFFSFLTISCNHTIQLL